MQGVSRVDRLLDRRFVQLKNENERLRLELFWTKYHAHKFSNALKFANKYGPACSCSECDLRGHNSVANFSSRPYDPSEGCAFRPWFIAKAWRCGVTIGHANDEGAIVKGAEKVGFRDPIYNVDTHLVFLNHRERNARYVHYGARLSNVTSVTDPELQKLVDLFVSLNENWQRHLDTLADDDEDDSEVESDDDGEESDEESDDEAEDESDGEAEEEDDSAVL